MATKFYMGSCAGNVGHTKEGYSFHEFFIVRVEIDDAHNRFFQFHEQYKAKENGKWKEIPVTMEIPLGKQLKIHYDIAEITYFVECCLSFDRIYNWRLKECPYFIKDVFKDIYPDTSWIRPYSESDIPKELFQDEYPPKHGGVQLDGRHQRDRVILDAMIAYLKAENNYRM